jgi:hypothetical protein
MKRRWKRLRISAEHTKTSKLGFQVPSDISHCRNRLLAVSFPPRRIFVRPISGRLTRRGVTIPVADKAADSVRPGEGLRTEKMPGHWVLARLGKRVLRPGGMQLTRRMLEALRIKRGDDVVEFAPGMGITARLTIELGPASYIAVERDEAAAKIVSGYLQGDQQRCVIGSASDTGLPAQSATVVYGEAMLTMQTEEMKRSIVREETERALTGVVHHGVRPLAVSEWRSLLESEGFEVQSVDLASMSLLEPRRLIRDEGFAGALRFAWNVFRDSEARRRVMEMRSVFRLYRKELAAVALVGIKR